MTRDEIVNAAREWVGTPFMHQGRSKGQAVDCIGLVVGTARALGVEVQDRTNYGREPHGHELPKALRAQLELKCSALTRVTGCGCQGKKSLHDAEMLPGDVVLFQFVGEPQHVGIITGYGVIHAFESVGKCVEHRMSDKWLRRIVEVYSFPGVDRG